MHRRQELGVRLAAVVFGLLMLAVLALSMAGIYAMMSIAVSRRRREIGIRTALGARPGVLLGVIFGTTFRQIALGVVIGITAALGIDRLAGGELLHGWGPPLLTGMTLLMAAVGLIAVNGPARRGLRIAPTEALAGD